MIYDDLSISNGIHGILMLGLFLSNIACLNILSLTLEIYLGFLEYVDSGKP